MTYPYRDATGKHLQENMESMTEGLVYLATSALEATYPNVGNWIIPDWQYSSGVYAQLNSLLIARHPNLCTEADRKLNILIHAPIAFI
jgi:hypothetical protein